MQLPATQPNLMPLLRSRTQLAAILYDLDGTIANTDPIHFKAWQECLSEFGIAIDEPFYKHRMTGRLNPAIVADLLPHLTPEAGLAVADRKEERFRELAQQLVPMTGLQATLDWATQEGFRQAVVTNAPRSNVDFLLDLLGLTHQFEQVIVSEEIGIGKPDPAPYQFALGALGIEPLQAIAFEDSPSGIRSAVAAGIPTIGIASTQTPADLYAVGASLVVENFADHELWSAISSKNR